MRRYKSKCDLTSNKALLTLSLSHTHTHTHTPCVISVPRNNTQDREKAIQYKIYFCNDAKVEHFWTAISKETVV